MIKYLSKPCRSFRDGNTTHYWDTETGEILAQEEEKNLKKITINKIAGVDVKWVSDCIYPDEFEESIKAIDGFVNRETNINTQELFADSNLGDRERRLLKTLFDNIIAWNYVSMDVKTLRNLSDIPSKHFSTVLKKLESLRFVEVVRRNNPHRGWYVIKVSPLLAWKGDHKRRDVHIQNWYLNSVRRVK